MTASAQDVVVVAVKSLAVDVAPAVVVRWLAVADLVVAAAARIVVAVATIVWAAALAAAGAEGPAVAPVIVFE